jgi:aerobic C4-dicarboxylate transport protein
MRDGHVLEHLGCSKPVVGLTVPSGYSFNLDGTSIYLTLAAIYVAQAQNVRLSIGQQLAILAVLLLTSKGAAGVTGSGVIVLPRPCRRSAGSRWRASC